MNGCVWAGNQPAGASISLVGMKIAIVTGAAQGIGRRTAEVLAEGGYGLLLMDMQACTATMAAVRGAGVEVEEVLGDISDEAVVQRGVNVVRSRWGRADVLVNNAGISFIAPAEAVEVAKFRRVLEVNLLAPFLLAKSVWRDDAGAEEREHCECGFNCRAGGGRGPVGVQRFEAWVDRADADAGCGVGRTGGSGECCLSGVGEDGDGYCGPGGRRRI